MPSNINIQNWVNGLKLNTTVGGGLESSAYSINATSAPPDRLVNYLTFNRQQGITNKKTFTFNTSFELGDIHFVIAISLTGTPTSSNYWIELSATGPDTTGQIATEKTGRVSTVKSVSFNLLQPILGGQTLNYTATLRRFLNGDYDDVTITIEPTTQSAPQ
ncbi:MAG: hypothetical protein R2729_22085 [Bryobacteraceae bacterium]